MVVEAAALGFRYQARGRAGGGFEGVELKLGAGVVLGVLGPNGAGKSTLLQVLATLLRPTSGTLRVLGTPVAQADPALRRRIGYTPDEPVHFRHLSGRENARFFGRAAGLAAGVAEARAERLLERFGLSADGDRPAGEYSYGMRRKLLLVEALVADPALWLLDEPTLGLDPPARDALRAALRQRASAGGTIIVATNDLPAAQSLCDRVLFLHEGRPVLEGEPGELLDRIGAGDWIDVTLACGATPSIAIEGVRVVEARPGRLRLRSSRGSALLPDICGELVRQAHVIRAIEVRSPDLRDVFHAATGTDLTAPSPAPGNADNERVVS